MLEVIECFNDNNTHGTNFISIAFNLKAETTQKNRIWSEIVFFSLHRDIAAECEAPAAAPEHGRLLDGSRQQARDIFPDPVQQFHSNAKMTTGLVGYWEITCEKGQWSNDPPVCRGMMMSLTSAHLTI